MGRGGILLRCSRPFSPAFLRRWSPVRLKRYHSNSICNLLRKRNHKLNYQACRSFSEVASKTATIYALSTAPGKAAIAIIRISGPACLTIYEALCPGKPAPTPRYAALRSLREPGKPLDDAQVLDSEALVLYFPAPETATGEDVLELHVHGGPAVVKSVLAAIPKSIATASSSTIRYAEPGEFTRRAFYNNRLDLTQVEALGNVLVAETEQQRRLAVRGTTSILAKRYESWRQKLLLARGELEALIDFSEDQHFDESPQELYESISSQVRDLRRHLQASIESASRGELLRHGINIALVGAPNVGKSSLLNQIVGREAAIVSSEPGTTRDVVDVNVDIGGFFCKFGDLAGLRREATGLTSHAIGKIEEEGMRRAKERALAADVIIAVFAATVRSDGEAIVDLDSEVLDVLQRCDTNKQKIVCVLNKADLLGNGADLESQRAFLGKHEILRNCMDSSETTVHAISCRKAQSLDSNQADSSGFQSFLYGLRQLFERMTTAILPNDLQAFANNSTWEESLGATERQRVLLEQCLKHLEDFLAEIQPIGPTQALLPKSEEDVDVVVAAECLRSAAECLAKVTGKGEAGDVEEVLGVVFEKFCVGK